MAETAVRCPILIEYELRLSNYALATVARHLNSPQFIKWIAPRLGPPRRLYDLLCSMDMMPKLRACPLTDRELADLQRAIDPPPSGTQWIWEPYEPVHGYYMETVSEVRRLAPPRVLHDWSAACGQFADRLSATALPLDEGLDTVCDWIRMLRKVMRACEGQAPQTTPAELTEPALDSQRLNRIETMVQSLLEQDSIKEWYNTAELAGLLGKAEFTVREWCRLGRIRAKKWAGGRGAHASWVVSHEELLRYRRDGLLKPDERP